MRIYSINYDAKNYKPLDLLKHYKEEIENRKVKKQNYILVVD